MRISTLAIAIALSCAALPAPAQDRPPAAAPVQEEPKDQSQPPAQDQMQVKPESVPKSVPKSQDRVEDKTPPAEANAPPKAPSRFTFNRVDKNFLRLDNETGQVAFCSPHGSGWGCEAAPEERAALEKEIARLQDEVTNLKTEVGRLTAPPPHPVPPQTVPPGPQAGKGGEAPIKLPTAEDLAQARAFLESAWRRLVEMIVNIQKDMMQKG
jgi:hypothetical protein